MKHLLYSVLLFGGLLYSVPASASGSLPAESGIYGRIVSEGKGASYVTVHINGTAIGTSTDYFGNFILTGLPEGRHILKIQGIGYR